MVITQPESTRSAEPASRPPRPRPASGPMSPVGHRTVRTGTARRTDRVPVPTVRTGHLVRQAAQGDQAAWDAVVQRYSGLLASVVRRSGLTEAQAADAVQTTWLRLLEDPAAMRRPEELAGWLRATARRVCREVVRSESTGPGQVPDGDGADPEAHVLRQERADLVRRGVEELPERSRQLLELLVADPPLGPAEISARAGLPVEGLAPARDRLLAQLRVALASADL